jgi:hypothetical protein
MATIRYRALDPNGDPLQGNGKNSFVSDLDAVAQAIGTRLRLFAGEWWENRSAGTPVFQNMLGVSGAGKHPETVVLILRQRILGTPYVRSVSNVAASYDPNTRGFAFSCQVQTEFGTLTLSNQPSNNNPSSS